MGGTIGSRKGSVAVLGGFGVLIAAATLAIVLWPMASEVENAATDPADPAFAPVAQIPTEKAPVPAAPQADAQVAAKAPVVAEAPVVSDVPAVEETPDVVEAPVVAEAPATVEAAPAVKPEVDTVRIDAAGGAIMAGTAAPGSQVEIRAGDDVVATGTASAGGDFAVLFDLPPSDTPRALSLTSTDTDGSSQVAEARVIVAATPEVESAPADDVTEDTTTAAVADPLVVQPPTILRADSTGVEVVQGAPELVTSIGIDTISYDAEGGVLLAGRGEADGQVRVYLNNSPVKTTEIGVDGTWRADLPEVETGIYTLRVDELAADGTVVSRLETPFQRTEPSVAAAQINEGVGVVSVQPGFTLWGIAEARFGDGLQYVQVFEANRDLIRNPDLIYPGQVFTLPAEIALQ